mmetsp:Transcript_61700/g.97422  ORF Transcript_61700/g.97422 Transcript_61700/m.97422 type:complete len:127 (-) Transcript_61700:52-432(-)
MFILFNGSLVHGVLPPTQKPRGERLVLIVNWWRRKPAPPKCDSFPTQLSKQMALKKEVLDGIVLQNTVRKVVPECSDVQDLWKGTQHTNFGMFKTKLPVPSAHLSGVILALGWFTSARVARTTDDL